MAETTSSGVGAQITNRSEQYRALRSEENRQGGILPAHQHPAVGDEIYLHPTAPPIRIEIVDPPNALVFFGSPAEIGAEESCGECQPGSSPSTLAPMAAAGY
jgi:hypothetical protein